jgi:hypothetical protein
MLHASGVPEKQGTIWASKGAALFRCGQGGGEAMGGGGIDGAVWKLVLGRLANILEGGFAPQPHSRDLSLENPELSLTRQVE